MKINRKIIKRTLLVAAISASAVALSSETSQADELFSVQPTTVYQVVKNQSLSDALTKVADRSGIEFQINTEIQGVIINEAASSDNWDDAIASLLKGFNFTTIKSGGKISKVIISGYNGNGVTNAVQTAVQTTAAKTILVKPNLKTLPARFASMPAGSVYSVDLQSVSATGSKSKRGEKVNFDLPMGQFTVTTEDSVRDADGNSIWSGHLTDEGVGYKVMVSSGKAGVIGNITTPDGVYNIESEKGSTYLVDTSKLDNVGFDNDTVEANEEILFSTDSTDDVSLSQLKTALDAAKLAYDTQQGYVDSYILLLATYKANLVTATSAFNLASTNLVIAKAECKAAANNLAPVCRTLSPLSGAYAKALVAFNTAKNLATNISTWLTTTAPKLTMLKGNYLLAQAAYDQVNTPEPVATVAPVVPVVPVATVPTAPVIPAPSASIGTVDADGNSIVDVMVLYTNVMDEAAKQRINYLIELSNKSYVDSGVKVKLRLVNMQRTSYVENNSNLTALGDLSSSRGALSNVSADRITYGADLVVLFRPLYALTAGSCGTTYVEFSNGSSANKWLGFATVSDGTSKDARTEAYCGANTFTHEIGHSFGLVHERKFAKSSGAFNYSYAYGESSRFGTIMSYAQPSVMLFSTPELSTQCAGTPCGFPEGNVNSSDQTRTMRVTVPQISNFMPKMVADPVN